MGTSESEIIPKKVFVVSFFTPFLCLLRNKWPWKKAVNGTLFGLALLTAAARMMIRFHFQKKLRSDDFVLLFACLSFTASQVLLYILKMDNIYWLAAVLFESSLQTPALILEGPEANYRRISISQRIHYCIGILTWTSIFAVKICFLLFFHQMITSLRILVVAWKVILGITIIFWALCSCTVFISCSNFGQATCKSILPSLPNYAPYWSKHLIKRSELYTRSTAYPEPCSEHHGSCSRYLVRLAP